MRTTTLLFTVVLVLAIFLMSTGASEAADLFTAPIFSGTNPDEVFCILANTGGTTQTSRIRIVQDDGTTVSDTGSHSLAAGAITSIGVFGNGQYHYCRFTVSTKSTARGSITFNPGGKQAFAVPAN